MTTIASCTPAGLHAALVTVHVRSSVTPGRGLSLAGLGVPTSDDGDAFASITAREASLRVRGALGAIGRPIAQQYLVNVQPRVLETCAPLLDLAVACAVLVHDTTSRELDGLLVIGELGPDGSVHGVSGMLAACELAQRQGLRGVLAPFGCASAARSLTHLAVFEIEHLSDAWRVITGVTPIERYHTRWDHLPRRSPSTPH